MPGTTTQVDVHRARQIWEEYQGEHDVSDRRGQTVAIDPVSGRIWFGESGVDIYQQMEREGTVVPVYLVRVGADYYVRKGGRR